MQQTISVIQDQTDRFRHFRKTMMKAAMAAKTEGKGKTVSKGRGKDSKSKSGGARGETANAEPEEKATTARTTKTQEKDKGKSKPKVLRWRLTRFRPEQVDDGNKARFDFHIRMGGGTLDVKMDTSPTLPLEFHSELI